MPTVLIIRDGWGMNPNPSHAPFDAIRVAQSRGLTPVADALMREYPWTLIKTSGEDVGLPGGGDDGELPTMGNSEVGHQNIGAGRIVYQESVAISLECRKGLEKNTEIAAAIMRAKQNGKAVHLLGIASDAGVHGLLTHLYAVLKACKSLGQTAVYLHLFTDGRDTGPFSGKEFVAAVEREAHAIGVGKVASICGRYYAMDRDYRWERVQSAYDVMTGRANGDKRFNSEAARHHFEQARSLHTTGSAEAAVREWMNGLRFDPSSLAGLTGFFGSLDKFIRDTDGQARINVEVAASASTNSDLTRYLGSVLAWGLKAVDAELAVAAFESAVTLGVTEPAQWIGERALAWVNKQTNPRNDLLLRMKAGFETLELVPAPRRRSFPTAAAAIQDYYDHPTNDSQKGDEFIPPRVIEGGAPIKDGDSVIFYNYRGDRPREISAAFVFPDAQWAKVKPSPDSGKHGFDRGAKLNLHYVIMTEYWEELLPHVEVAFPKPPKMVNIAGEYLSKLGLTQFRCAETEKYPHVTFFFNDYRDQPFPGETRENPQSPKVATYDLKPEMSAAEVRDAVLRRLATPDCQDFIVVNFANGDMVGHTGNLEAAVKAVATVDACVGAIVDATLKRGGKLLVFADHGNCEQMFDPETGSPHTAHTIYDVPIIVVDPALKGSRLRGDQNVAGWFDPKVRANRGRLADVVPTALALMGREKPREMLGQSLLA